MPNGTGSENQPIEGEIHPKCALFLKDAAATRAEAYKVFLTYINGDRDDAKAAGDWQESSEHAAKAILQKLETFLKENPDWQPSTVEDLYFCVFFESCSFLNISVKLTRTFYLTLRTNEETSSS